MKARLITTMMLTLFLASMALSVELTSALASKFVGWDLDGDRIYDVVVRMPQKPRANKPFNVGIYVCDDLVSTDGSGGDPDLAELYINVTGPEGATIVGWNDWFGEDAAWFDTDVPPVLDGNETLGDPDANNQIDPTDDLIGTYYWVDPDASLPTITGDEYLVTSMGYGARSKLGGQSGWSGATVWRASASGTYTFTLKDAGGTTIVEFQVEVGVAPGRGPFWR